MIQSPALWVALVLGPLLYWRVAPNHRGWIMVGTSLAVTLSAFGPLSLIYPFFAGVFYIAANKLNPAGRKRVLVLLSALMLSIKPIFLPLLRLPAIPQGINFMALRYTHLIIDVLRDRIQVNSFKELLVWTTFFPIQAAGPVQRYDLFFEQAASTFDRSLLVEGTRRIAYGVAKSASIWAVAPHIRTLHPVTDPNATAYDAWVYLLVGAISGYINFSAYTDVAIGAGRFFGFRVSENFNFPFLARNPAEWWRRWNITKLEFVRAYVYLPVLARTRSPTLSLFALFTAIAFMHKVSWNWLLWGVTHSLGLSIFVFASRKLRKRKIKITNPFLQFGGVVLTWLLVCVARSFALTERWGVSGAFTLLGRMFGVG